MATTIPFDMKIYKYVVDSFVVLIPGAEPMEIDPKHITDMGIERDYDNDYYPIIRVSFVISPTNYFIILKNKLEVKFKLRMQKYAYDNDNNFQFKSDVFNKIFSVYLNEDTPFMDESSYTEIKKVERSETTPPNVDNEFTFYLFDEADLVNSRRIMNNIFTSSNMTDIITFSLGRNGINKVLMTPLDNKSVYSEVIFPPLPVLGGILELEQTYGFYNNGSLIFFDIDCMYILDINVKCTAYRPNEYTRTMFHIRDSTNSDVFTPGSYVDAPNKQFIISVLPSNIQMHTHSIVVDQTEGNNLFVIHPESGTASGVESDSTERKVGTRRVLVNKTNNKYCNTGAKIERSENSRVISISIGDFDISNITPNKEFFFTFENQKINMQYGGSYRISKYNTVFTKQGEYFVVSGTCEFKRYN